MRHFQALVQIDSTDPPGNETRVVDYVRKIFDAEGIPYIVAAQSAETESNATESAPWLIWKTRPKASARTATRNASSKRPSTNTCNSSGRP
jgi:hypothetical protein